MANINSYYLYQKYEKRGDQPWIPLDVYSVDGDGTMPLVLKEHGSDSCPVIPDGTDDYAYTEWRSADGYMCDDGTKYARERRYVSNDNVNWTATDIYRITDTVIQYNSTDCGYSEDVEEYDCDKWEVVANDYICNEGNKCQKLRKYVRVCNDCDNCNSSWVATDIYQIGETVIEYNSNDCGYTASTEEYRWVNVGYVCVGNDKCYRQQKQVSYTYGDTWENLSEYRTGDVYQKDSADCTITPVIYRWVNLNPSQDYYCDGTTKYYKQQYQKSYNNGLTWVSEIPPKYQWGDVYETESTDCGYIPPEYRVVSTATTCVGYDKHQLNEYQRSDDGGESWYTVSATSGSLIETNSIDCGYPSSASSEYFSFVALESGYFTYSDYKMAWENGTNSFSYSLDSGATWNSCQFHNDNLTGSTPTVQSGDVVMWKGTPSNRREHGIINFNSTCRFNVKGNAMSLIYGDNFNGQTNLQNYTLTQLFSGLNEGPATKLVSAKELVLPATNFKGTAYLDVYFGCYAFMFSGCTSLVEAPTILPAMDLTAYGITSACYQGMFQDCTSLTKSPILPATTIPRGRYSLAGAYAYMFNGCTSLSSITCLATNGIGGSDNEPTRIWVEGVSPNGIFYKSPNATNWTRGDYGIPNGWTIVNYTS